MKKIIPSLVLLLLAASGYCQADKTPPDFKKMETEIADKQSPYYYPSLMKKYKDNDTTLTGDEYHYLYYGYSFQPAYQPYGQSSLVDALKKATSQKDKDKAIELEKKILDEYPFNLRDIYNLENLYKEKGDSGNAAIYHHKLINVGRAIYFSGDGLTDSTAMYVISVDHEYDMIGLLGYRFGGTQALVRRKGHAMDKMAILKNDEGITFLYFNVDRLFESFMKPGKKD